VSIESRTLRCCADRGPRFRAVDDSQWKVEHKQDAPRTAHQDDDEAKGSTLLQSGSKGAHMRDQKKPQRGGDWGGRKERDKKKERGQNKNRQFGSWGDQIPLCNTRALRPEFSPEECKYGWKCKLEHDLRKYLAEGKREDLTTFDGKCPTWEERGVCHSGWKCRFVGSHSTERDLEDGRKELVLLEDESRKAKAGVKGSDDPAQRAHVDDDVYNVVSNEAKFNLQRRKTKTEKADKYLDWLNESWNKEQEKRHFSNGKPDKDRDHDRNKDAKKSHEQRSEENAKVAEKGDGLVDTKVEETAIKAEDKTARVKTESGINGDIPNMKEGSKTTTTVTAATEYGEKSSKGEDEKKHITTDQNDPATAPEKGATDIKAGVSMEVDNAEIGIKTEKAEYHMEIDNAAPNIKLEKAEEPVKGDNAATDIKTGTGEELPKVDSTAREDHRAAYVNPPLLPSEKRRIYYGPDTPVLAPLTTQGNLPFRRLCVELGAQVTWSEMAMGMPLVQGEKGEWALMKCHASETRPPKVKNDENMAGYDNAKDLKFGAQIAANKPWIAYKSTEVLATHIPHLRAIDLNCGCPIDLVYKSGAGSALLDVPSKLEKILRGMNTLSGEIPVTVKIRTGTKDKEPNADKLVNRLVLGSYDSQKAGLGPCGVAAITLHGRSRQQRYTKLADWGYISDIAALINRIQKDQDNVADTAAEQDARHLPNGGKTYFLGNGDCYSHVDYFDHINQAGVDSVMLGRGALIKPWLFEEIESQQYLDKSATERLGYIEKFVRYGLQCWGSDEAGIGTTRRFLLEWLNFSHRYVPLGILEHLPPKINERPPRFRGRNELESLLASKVCCLLLSHCCRLRD
jgi:tRNA-dihydrouridine synthase